MSVVEVSRDGNTYKDFLGVADSPGEVLDSSISRNNCRGEIDAKQKPDRINQALCILAVPFHEASKRFLGSAGSCVRVAVQTILDYREERTLDRLLI